MPERKENHYFVCANCGQPLIWNRSLQWWRHEDHLVDKNRVCREPRRGEIVRLQSDPMDETA